MVDARRTRRWFTVTPSCCGRQERGPAPLRGGASYTTPPLRTAVSSLNSPLGAKRSRRLCPAHRFASRAPFLTQRDNGNGLYLFTVRNLAAYVGFFDRQVPSQAKNDRTEVSVYFQTARRSKSSREFGARPAITEFLSRRAASRIKRCKGSAHGEVESFFSGSPVNDHTGRESAHSRLADARHWAGVGWWCSLRAGSAVLGRASARCVRVLRFFCST